MRRNPKDYLKEQSRNWFRDHLGFKGLGVQGSLGFRGLGPLGVQGSFRVWGYRVF